MTTKRTATEWKVGDRVSIGMLKNLEVKSIERHGDIQRFSLLDHKTNREYTFTPGGLRKTFEPPATVLPQSATNAISTLRKVLERRCRRGADAETRQDLEKVIRILTPTIESTSPPPSSIEGTLSPANNADAF